MFECPIRLFMYGPSDPVERDRIEASMKQDKIAKATELKRTKQEAEERRKRLGLVSSGTTVSLGAEPENAESALTTLLQSSEAVEFRKEADPVKALAMGEEQLEKMPMAEQPPELKATLLPYQLQVCLTPPTTVPLL